jgi:hypothetical protein
VTGRCRLLLLPWVPELWNTSKTSTRSVKKEYMTRKEEPSNKTVNNLHAVYSRVKTNSPDRTKNDFYPTAPVATYSLFHTDDFQKALFKCGEIWEPAAGKGHISSELQRLGCRVVSTDLYEYENPLVPIETGVDFLGEERLRAPAVVTNPPFYRGLPELLVRRMLDQGALYVAVFCRLTWMESTKRNIFFMKDCPPSTIHVLSGRVHCSEEYFQNGSDGSGGMIGYAWYTWCDWDPGAKRISWINTKEMSNKRIGDTYGIF